MYNSISQQMQGRGGDQQRASAEISDDSPSVSVCISNIIQIWDIGKIVVVEI